MLVPQKSILKNEKERKFKHDSEKEKQNMVIKI